MIIHNLDGDGLEAVADTTINPHFDMNGDGFAERAGWVRGGDAFLVQDNNATGTIDDISEMFGSPTQDGYSELATLDTNADGKLDALDAAWSTLKLWRDADFDGVTDAGELLTLDSQNIVSIAVNPTVTTPDEHTGFTITATGTFTRADTSTGATGRDFSGLLSREGRSARTRNPERSHIKERFLPVIRQSAAAANDNCRFGGKTAVRVGDGR